MLRKISFGILWFLALYFGSCMLIGGIVGAKLGAINPQNAYEAGRAAGADAASLAPYAFFGSLLIAIVGAASGILPGTKKKVAPDADLTNPKS